MKITIIRTTGAEEEHSVPMSAALDSICKLIGAATLDTVNLHDGRVMYVDDGGYETQLVQHSAHHFESQAVKPLKAVNPKATDMYHAVCVPGTTHEIVGDVAIVLDRDFA